MSLPTGSGKTLIAAMLIRKNRSETSKPLAEGGRRTVFLVPTIVLAQQQGEYLRRHTDMKVKEYYGSKEVEWNGQRLSCGFTSHLPIQYLISTVRYLQVDERIRNQSSAGYDSSDLCKYIGTRFLFTAASEHPCVR